MSLAMSQEMPHALERLLSEPDLRVVVVRGEGKVFCAGGDLDMLQRQLPDDPARIQPFMRGFYESFLAIRRIPCPTVAILQGAAIGAGFCFPLACDIRLAAADAKLGLNFVRLGIHPGMAATHWVTRLVGEGMAMELLLTGRLLSGEEGARIGLVNRAVPADQLTATAEALVEELRTAAPAAVRLTKESVRLARGAPLETVLEHEAASQSLTLLSPEAKIGIAAARERKPPEF